MQLTAKSSQEKTTEHATALRRIAVVGPSLDILGGQGVQAAALMDALRSEGFDIVFIPVNPRFPRMLAWVRKIPYLRTILNQGLYRLSLRQIRNVDMVHLFSASYWSFSLAQVPAIKAARHYGKQVVLNYHSGEADDHLKNWGKRVHPWLEKVDRIVVPSVYLKQVFSRYGYASQVIPNIIKLDQFNYRTRSPLKPRLLSVRNLEPIYRVENTLSAFALIKKRLPEATLTIAGYGSMQSTLMHYVRDKGLSDVFFIGRVEPADIAAVYNDADIFINSSVVDNQPVSILEAFAAGLPVISTPTGDIAYMIRDQENGLVVPEDQPARIADAVFWLLEHPHESTLIATAARTGVDQHTWGQVRRDWITLFSGEPA